MLQAASADSVQLSTWKKNSNMYFVIIIIIIYNKQISIPSGLIGILRAIFGIEKCLLFATSVAIM